MVRIDNSEVKSRKAEEEGAAVAGLSDVGDGVNQIILTHLGGNDIANFACVTPAFRFSTIVDDIWERPLLEDFYVSSPVGPDGATLPGFRAAYYEWRASYSMYPWNLVKRGLVLFRELQGWLRKNLPGVADTLRKGVTESQLDEFEEKLGVKLPAPTRVLYRMFDGQDVRTDRLCGLIGGYRGYNQLVNVYLLSLEEVRSQTEELRSLEWYKNTSNRLVVAQSPFDDQKEFLLDCESGQLYVSTLNYVEEGDVLPCVPATLLHLARTRDNNIIQDGLLLWVEEHFRRLQNGVIGIRGEADYQCIFQIPELPPPCNTAVKDGVQVHASAFFVPERSDLRADDKYCFRYSIGLSLLNGGCTINGEKHNSCQLYWRDWVVRDDTTDIMELNGEAVETEYPHLYSGEEEAIYHSHISISRTDAVMEGFLTFAPGSLEDPVGRDDLEVEVPPFSLKIPDFIF